MGTSQNKACVVDIYFDFGKWAGPGSFRNLRDRITLLEQSLPKHDCCCFLSSFPPIKKARLPKSGFW
jgi:hypothetical protein